MDTIITQIVVFKVLKKCVNDHRSEVKDKQAAGDPEKSLFRQLFIDLFGLYRFIEIAAAEHYDEKGAEQESVAVEGLVKPLEKDKIGDDRQQENGHDDEHQLFEGLLAVMDVEDNEVENKLQRSEDVIHGQFGEHSREITPAAKHFYEYGKEKKGYEISDQPVALPEIEKDSK